MKQLQTITIKEYLNKKGIKYQEAGGELIAKCLFNNCDQNSRQRKGHLYFSIKTSQYHCKKCDAQGNIITLAKHLGDKIKDIKVKNSYRCVDSTPKANKKQPTAKFDTVLVEKCHLALPQHIRQYLHARGIVDTIIERFKLGYGKFYGKNWIIIPVKDINGNFIFLKLRSDPQDNSNPDKYKFYPAGSSVALYGLDLLGDGNTTAMICEGEFDCMLLWFNGIPAITSTAGAGTFKREWLEQLKNLRKLYVCMDKDKTGEKGGKKLIKLLGEKLSSATIYKTALPDRMTGNDKDVSDYFTKHNGNPDELIYELSKHIAGRKPIDPSRLKPITSKDLINILGLTIKRDEENKLVTFLCELAAYTEDSQFNISFNAPSSTGKSYIPTEIARLFPKSDVIEIAYCSPTAFFHDVGKLNKERGGYEVNLSRKILIFLDQPHTMLLERLRPLLSHDKKEIHLKITDKSQKGGLRTKNVFIQGYPSVIFCSAGLKIDEQEGTRFVLLSPETNQEKIREAIQEKIRKDTDNSAYSSWLNSNSDRLTLKERIEVIKEAKIKEIKINKPTEIEKRFFVNKKILKPRHQRDIGRLIALIKTFALLNLWFREQENGVVIANDDDINEAMKIWEKISESQEYNLPPYIFNLYNDIIVPAYQEKNKNVGEVMCRQGLTRQEILKKHYQTYGRMIESVRLRQQIIPMLETAGLINQETDKNDKRKLLIHPTS